MAKKDEGAAAAAEKPITLADLGGVDIEKLTPEQMEALRKEAEAGESDTYTDPATGLPVVRKTGLVAIKMLKTVESLGRNKDDISGFSPAIAAKIIANRDGTLAK